MLGSAGGPRHALPLLTDGRRRAFLIVNGDTLSTVDLAALLARHAASGARGDDGADPESGPDEVRRRQGVDDDGYVTGFSRAGTGGESFHFVGVQVAEARAFAALEDGVPAESVNALYPRLIAARPGSDRGVRLATRRSATSAPRATTWRRRWRWPRLEGDDSRRARGSTIDDSATVERTVVWDDVTIGRGVAPHRVHRRRRRAACRTAPPSSAARSCATRAWRRRRTSASRATC